MNGGPKPGSGRRPIEDRDWVRSRSVRVSFRPGEFEDLRAIVRVWGVPVAVVPWVVVHDWLAGLHQRERQLGEHGLAIAAGLAVIRRPNEPGNVTTEEGGSS